MHEHVEDVHLKTEELTPLSPRIVHNNISSPYAKFFVIQLASWWFFSSIYSIEVKKFLILNPDQALEASLVSLALSVICAIAFMKRDELTNSNVFSVRNFKALLLVSSLHLLGTVSTNFSVSLMAVSFTHVVKAVEPVFTIIWSIVLAKKGITTSDDISVEKISIVGFIIVGVIISSLSEVTFSWAGLIWGMISNLSFSGRNVLSKHAMSQMKMSKDSLYLILNLTGALITLGVMLLTGKVQVFGLDEGSYSSLFYSGLSYFLYTAISMNILEGISPITHAISNTCKRFVVVFVSVIAFAGTFTLWSSLGTFLTIGGVAAYSLTDSSKNRKKQTSSKVTTAAVIIILTLLLVLAGASSGAFNFKENSAILKESSEDNNNNNLRGSTGNQKETTLILTNPVENVPLNLTVPVKEKKQTSKEIIYGLQEKILEKLAPIFQGRPNVVLLCHPDYRNRGDSALYVGQIAFIKRMGLNLLYECA